jgi:hypothetical protein
MGGREKETLILRTAEQGRAALGVHPWEVTEKGPEVLEGNATESHMNAVIVTISLDYYKDEIIHLKLY